MAMLLPVIGSVISNVLLDKGLNLLGSATRNITDAGIEALGDLVKSKTGIDITDKDDLHNLNTEQVLKLREFEIQELESINRSMVEYNKDIVRDKESARALQIATLSAPQSSWIQRHFIYIYSVGLTTAILGYIFMATFYIPVNEQNTRIVDISLGWVFGILSTMVAFFFGSDSSMSKNNTANIFKKQSDTQANKK